MAPERDGSEKTAENRRQVTLHVKVTEDERAIFKALADEEGLTLSAFLRSAARYYAAMPESIEAEAMRFREIETLLRGAATNLNQLARAANRGGLVWTEDAAEDVGDLRKLAMNLAVLFGDFRRAARRRRVDLAARSLAFLRQHGGTGDRP